MHLINNFSSQLQLVNLLASLIFISCALNVTVTTCDEFAYVGTCMFVSCSVGLFVGISISSNVFVTHSKSTVHLSNPSWSKMVTYLHRKFTASNFKQTEFNLKVEIMEWKDVVRSAKNITLTYSTNQHDTFLLCS